MVDADELVAEMISDARQTSDELGKVQGHERGRKNRVARIVGLGALKYFILKVDARKNMLFNPAESIDFNGNTGPFIQYTYARIRSILRKAEAEGIAISRNAHRHDANQRKGNRTGAEKTSSSTAHGGSGRRGLQSQAASPTIATADQRVQSVLSRL